MKIAVLFSGRVYKFGSHYNNIMENVVQDHDADFYLSHSPELNEETELELFKEIYNPVAVCNDPIPDKGTEFEFEEYPIPENVITVKRNVVSMFYNRKRVFELMKASGNEYDCIVSYRLDLFSQSKIDYTNLGKSIHIPEGQDYNGGINDQIAYGTYEPMSIYMNLFDSMKQYLDKKKSIFFPELLNKCHLFENNISVIRVPYNYKIVRGGHSLFD
jgi:hypothetical protein